MISNVAERADNVPLFHFRRNVEKWLIIQPIPLVVEQTAQKEIQHLTRYAENFAQWYRHVIQEDGSVVFGAYEQLKEVLPGFVCLNLRESGNSRVLTVTFLIADQDRVFEFQDVSDGQRQLIILYLIAEALRKGLVSTLILDEPDNFVSLREVRPFLGLLEEITDELPQQAIIISHHPEVINEMGHEGELWFSRREGAHTTTKPYPVTPGLTPAENMARGWGDE